MNLTKTPYLVLFILLGAVGVGTASALMTITLAGDVVITDSLSVDTDTLVVDSTNNRVGIGTLTPTEELHVGGNIKSVGSVIANDFQYKTTQTKKIVIAAGEFNSLDNSGNLGLNGIYSSLTGSTFFHAPVHTIPDGAKITRIDCSLLDNSAVFDSECKLVFVTDMGFIGSPLVTIKTTGAPTGDVQIKTAAGLSIIVDRDTRAYLIQFNPTDNSCGSLCQLHAVAVTYEITGPT